MREQFLNLLKSTGRERINQLCAYLDTDTDFFKAPASTVHHGAKEGGLLEHSLAVYDCLLKIYKSFDGYVVIDESKIIVSLLHDICKANFYTVSTRNVKINGVWERVPYYAVEDQFPVGHGEKSVIIAQQFIGLTTEEIMAIRWHMGGWEDSARGYSGQASQSAAMKRYPLITALHMADLAASYFDNK